MRSPHPATMRKDPPPVNLQAVLATTGILSHCSVRNVAPKRSVGRARAEGRVSDGPLRVERAEKIHLSPMNTIFRRTVISKSGFFLPAFTTPHIANQLIPKQMIP